MVKIMTAGAIRKGDNVVWLKEGNNLIFVTRRTIFL